MARAPTDAPAPQPPRHRAAARGGRRARALVKIGIVGLPNAGKTTLFNALTRAGAETAAYPFTTVEPNVAVVDVPDERLAAVAAGGRREPAGPGDDRVPRHRRPGARRLGGRGARQPLPRRDPRDRRDLPRRPHPRRRAGPPSRRPRRPARRRRGGGGRAAARRPRAGERRLERVRKEAGSGAKEAAAERDWLRAGGRGARPGRAGARACRPRRWRRTRRRAFRR